MNPCVRHALFVISLLLSAAFAHADSPRYPESYVTTSPGGKYAFHMIAPDTSKRNRPKEDGEGIAYEITQSGEYKEIWRTTGWYSFQVFLFSDGKHLVRMGPWNSGYEPRPDHLAVAFYEDGKLLKSYSTSDLVKDRSKIRPSASHYRWLADEGARELDEDASPPHFDWPREFVLQTIDGIIYRFDVTNGQITSSETAAERATGWASLEEIERISVAVALAKQPFSFLQLRETIGLPRKAATVSSGLGDSFESNLFALTDPREKLGYYALEVELEAKGDLFEHLDKPSSDKVIALRLMFITADGRELPILLRKHLQKAIDELDPASKAAAPNPRELSEQILRRLAERGHSSLR